MPKEVKKKLKRVKRREQLDALSSPIRLAIVDLLNARGPLSAADLAVALERKQNSIYYHLKKLMEVGVVAESGTRKTKRRDEQLYRVAVERFELSYEPTVDGSAEALAKFTTSLLRMAQRDARTALQQGDIIEEGPRRNFHIGRSRMRLTKDELAELNDLIDQFETFFRRLKRDSTAPRYGFTVALTPLERDG